MTQGLPQRQQEEGKFINKVEGTSLEWGRGLPRRGVFMYILAKKPLPILGIQTI